MRALSLVLAALAAMLVAAPIVRADEFERFHPDQMYRRLGAEAWETGRRAEAVTYFKRAARYADKPSQLALAIAHWEGEGVAVNRPLAYVYADISAERGYPDFVVARERYWAAMTAEEQAEAKRIGPAIHAELGDHVAKKRLEGKLKLGLSRKTGTRTGSSVSSVGTSAVDSNARAQMTAALSSALNNVRPGAAALEAGYKMQLLARIMREVGARNAVNYYSDANWRPRAYWAAQDAQWSELEGVVEVEPLRKDG